MCEIPTESLKIPDMNKTSLHVFLTWQEKEKSASNQTPRFLTTSTGGRILPSKLTKKKLHRFAHTVLEPSKINSVLSGLSLFAENHFFDVI